MTKLRGPAGLHGNNWYNDIAILRAELWARLQ
jgi:hypothetical protein